MNSIPEKLDISEIRKIKDTAKCGMRDEFGIPKSVPLLALVHISNKETREFILAGLSAIGIGNISIIDPSGYSIDQETSTQKEKSSQESPENTEKQCSSHRYSGVRTQLTENDFYAFDCVIYDGESDGIDLVRLMRAGVVPVTSDRTIFA